MYIEDNTTNFNYDIIISFDLLANLDNMLTFETKIIIWQNIVVPMKNPGAIMEESYHIRDRSVNFEHDRMRDIIDAT